MIVIHSCFSKIQIYLWFLNFSAATACWLEGKKVAISKVVVELVLRKTALKSSQFYEYNQFNINIFEKMKKKFIYFIDFSKVFYKNFIKISLMKCTENRNTWKFIDCRQIPLRSNYFKIHFIFTLLGTLGTISERW